MLLLRKIESLFSHLEKRIKVRLRIDTYEFKDGKIIKNIGPWRSIEISMDDLLDWQIIPEMGFDVVVLETKRGQRVVWIDTYDDLVGILRNNFRELEHLPA
jgi:hypothetical protein